MDSFSVRPDEPRQDASGCGRGWLASTMAVGFLVLMPLSASPAHAEVTFAGGWESGVLLGPGLWRSVQLMRDDSISLVEDVVRQGRFAARIELRPGDNPLQCCPGSDRAEVLGMTRPDGSDISENADSGAQYFGFSIRLAADWSEPEWNSFVQLHGPDEYDLPAAFALRVNAGRFIADVNGGDISEPFRSHYDAGPVVLNTWVDFIVRIDFAISETGAVAVWRRDEGQEDFGQQVEAMRIATLQSRDGVAGDHYWKAGFYRATKEDVAVVWLDGVTRADTFEEVVATAFAPPQRSQPPRGFAFAIRPADMEVKTVGDKIDHSGWVLFANGQVADKILLPESGEYEIEVVARGTKAGDTWPIMLVGIDEMQHAFVVDTAVSRPFVSSFKVEAGEREFSVSFVNDGAVGEEDRNLYLKMVRIRSGEFEPF